MDPDVTKPRPPPAIAGNFELIRKMGSGGFGSVFEARDRSTGLPYAVKRIALSTEDAARFEKEALYPARIASQSLHVLSMHSFFQDEVEGYFYLVTELIPHGDLRRFLDTQPQPLPVAMAFEIAVGIAKGLAAIHEQGIVHRDLKPGNILMDRKDDRWVPKIADFGLARSTGSMSIGEFASSGYAAPEQLDLRAEPRLGPESDVFSFGMVLYELLTGYRASEAKELREYSRWTGAGQHPQPPSERRPELAGYPDLDPLVRRLLEFDPDLRTISVAEVVRTLSAACRAAERREELRGEPEVQVTMRRPPAPANVQPPPSREPAPQLRDPPKPPIRRKETAKGKWIAGAVVVIAAAVTAAVWFGSGSKPGDAARKGVDEFKAGRYARALPLLLDAAEGGDADARSALGRMYVNGWGVQSDPQEARKWLDLAAAQENADARCALGDLLRDPPEPRYDEALKRYSAAAGQGAACGQRGVGQMHEHGLGVPASYDEAARWYEMAADKGDAAARASLAELQKGWVLEPLFVGAWRQVQGKERRDEVGRLRSSGVVARVSASSPPAAGARGQGPPPDLRRMRRLDLEFYDGAAIFEVEVGRAAGQAGILTYIRKGDRFVLVNGTSPPIHELSATVPIRIDTMQRAIAFLRFFMGAVQGERGIFRVIDGVNDLHWLPAASPQERAALAPRVQRLEVEPSPSGGWRAKGTVEFGRALFHADLWLKPNGAVDMTDDKAIADDLPVSVERFDEKGVRVTVNSSGQI